MRKLLVATALIAAATACVPKKDYLALESEYASTKQSLQTEIAHRDATITRLEGEVSALNQQALKTKQDLAAKQKELDELRSQTLSEQGAMTAEIDRMKAALAELEARKASAEARLNEFRSLVARFQKMIDAGTLQVKIVDGRMVVALATDILFPSGSATLSREGKTAISEVAGILASIADRQFQVEGHTDNVPIASAQFPSNWYLAAARAINVTETMVSGGLPPDRISAASFGEFRPVDTNKTKEGRALNRRIEIVVVPDLSQLPGYDELLRMK